MTDIRGNEEDLQRWAHQWLEQDDLTAEERALLPARFADIQRTQPRFRRMVQARRLRIAATIAVLLAAGAMFGPTVSAAVARWFERDGVPVRDERVPLPAPGSEQQHTTSGYSFVPRGDVVTVRFASAQSQGRLFVTRSSAANVEFQLQREGTAVPMTVLPDGILVGNAAHTSATYRVELPVDVRRLDVEVGGDVVERLMTKDLRDGRIISIAGSRQ